jgi:hypothetical protein
MAVLWHLFPARILELIIIHYAYITLDFGMNLGLKYKGLGLKYKGK